MSHSHGPRVTRVQTPESRLTTCTCPVVVSLGPLAAESLFPDRQHCPIGSILYILHYCGPQLGMAVQSADSAPPATQKTCRAGEPPRCSLPVVPPRRENACAAKSKTKLLRCSCGVTHTMAPNSQQNVVCKFWG